MVKGLDIFRRRFHRFENRFVLIGGVACDEWLAAQGLAFRATKDLDIVLLIEALDAEFVNEMRRFLKDGGYSIRQTNSGTPKLYRFAKPTDTRFPFMLELFSRSPDGFELSTGQKIVPVEIEPGHHSLSAILMDDSYYRLIQSHGETRNGLKYATVAALIPLKARAWLDLVARRDREDNIDSKDIEKHRNDVFRLAATLPDESGPELSESITADLARFLASVPEDSSEWPRILDALKTTTLSGDLRPGVLLDAIHVYFRLPARFSER